MILIRCSHRGWNGFLAPGFAIGKVAVSCFADPFAYVLARQDVLELRAFMYSKAMIGTHLRFAKLPLVLVSLLYRSLSHPAGFSLCCVTVTELQSPGG